jgi:hypothetical protein
LFFASTIHNPLKGKRKALASEAKGNLKEIKTVSTVGAESMCLAFLFGFLQTHTTTKMILRDTA